MAKKKIVDEQIKLEFILDGNEAQKQLNDLGKKSRELKESITELTAEEKKLSKEVEKVTTQKEKLKSTTDELSTSFNKLSAKHDVETRKLKDLELQQGKNSTAYKEQKASINKLEKEMTTLYNNLQKSISAYTSYNTKNDGVIAKHKEVQVSLNKTTQEFDQNKKKIDEVKASLNLHQLTLAQLTTKAQFLRQTLRHLIPDSADYIRIQNDLKQVTSRMDELRGRAQATGSTIGTVADNFNRYAALAASLIATLTGVVLSIQQVVDYNGKLSDSQSDVMKTTGMTKKEVDELTKSFGLFKTRTARMELLKLAEEGGRLGIEGVEGIQKWVNVANQLKVALGDDLSETQIREVGKMVQVYRVGEETGRDFEGAMLSLGSAINEVSASGSNQAGFLVDFMKRTGGLSQIAKLSSADNLGYAATFDEIGQSAEVAGTVMNKLMTDMFKAPDQYAKIAKMNVGEFTKLLNTDFNAAMIAFLKGLDGNQAGLSLLTARMEDLDIGGARGSAAIAGLASNLEILEQRQTTSNFAMIEATSLTDEYSIKNENLASILDKIKQRIVGWYSSETFVKWLTDAVTWFGKFIGATDDVDHSTSTLRNNIYFLSKILAILIAGLVSYTAAMKLYTFWTTRGVQGTILFNLHLKIQNTLAAIALVRTEGLAIAQMLLAGNVRAAIVQFRLLNATLGISPIGAIIGLVTVLTTAYLMFRDEVKKTNDVLLVKEKIENKASEATSNHKAQVNSLIEVIRSSKTSIEQKEKALTQLHKITNGYLDTLNLENATTWQSINLIDNYIKHIDALARAKAAVSLKSKLYEEQEANEAKIRAKSAEKENTDEGSVFTRYNESGNFLGVQFGRNKNHVQLEIEELKKNGESIKNQLGSVKDNQNRSVNYLQKSIEADKNKLVWLQKGTTAYISMVNKIRSEEERLAQFLQVGSDSPEINTPTEPTGFTPVTDPKKKKGKTDAEKAAEKESEKQKREHEKRLEEIEKFHNDKLKLAREFEDGNFELMADGYAKEKQILDTQSSRKIEDLRAKLIKEEEITKAQNQAEILLNKSKNDKLTDEQRKTYEVQSKSYSDIANAWLDNNAEIHQKIEQETDLHHLRLGTLVEKYSVSEIDLLKKKYDSDKVARDTAFNNQLVALGDNERAKEKLKKQFDQSELDAEQKHLESLVAVYNKMMAGGTINGIDFSLLSNEDAAELQKNIDLVNLAISQLIAKKTELKNGSGKEKGLDLSNGEKSLGIGQADILGFSQDQWTKFLDNIEKGKIGIETVKFAAMALQNVWAQYDAMVSAGENKRLKQYESQSTQKESRLKKQLDRGVITQEQYNKAVDAIEADYARKKAQIEYNQAKRKKNMDLASAVANTAIAVTEALPNWILAGLVGAMGALQIATIARQPLPSVSGYEKGLYGDHLVRREQDGKVFKTTYGGKTRSGVVNKNTMYMVGENGPEMVIDNKAFRKMNPQLRDSLIRELRGIKGFEHGYYNQQSMQVAIPEAGNLPNGELIAAIIQLNQLLTRLEENGVRAYVSNKDYKSMENVRKGIKDFENFRDRNKVTS